MGKELDHMQGLRATLARIQKNQVRINPAAYRERVAELEAEIAEGEAHGQRD